MSRLPPPAPFSPSGPLPKRHSDGRLVAAGVMVLVQALFVVLVGLAALLLAFSDGPWFEQTKSQHFRSVALAVGLLGGGVVLLSAGVAAMRGRHWARTTIIVVEPLLMLPYIVAIATDSHIDGRITVLSLGWAVTSFGLAVASRSPAP